MEKISKRFCNKIREDLGIPIAGLTFSKEKKKRSKSSQEAVK